MRIEYQYDTCEGSMLVVAGVLGYSCRQFEVHMIHIQEFETIHVYTVPSFCVTYHSEILDTSTKAIYGIWTGICRMCGDLN